MTAELQRFRQLIAQAATGEPLAPAAAREAFDLMMTGNATPAQVAGLLMALRVRGETDRGDHRRCRGPARPDDPDRGTARRHRHLRHGR